MTSRTRRSPAALAVAVLLAGVLAGCGDDEPDEPPAPSSPATSGPASSPAPSPSSEPSSPDASPTGASADGPPATGDRIELDHIAVNLPEGWTKLDQTPRDSYAYDPAGGAALYLLDRTAFGDTDAAADSVLEGYADRESDLRRLADLEVGGVAGYVLQGSVPSYPFYFEWGAVHGGRLTSVQITFTERPDDPFAVISPVLASLTLE
ncbi:hypothetical protein [Nocardioides sp. SYSU D00038]|uniref:hypothetical protein n=1 Tax=Nocardioides sp. SYSU D00038 TaxID=2812554 RepID=UPI0019684D54|nr:hypothetical protein [Nocardioides sp. SYSU D00038]